MNYDKKATPQFLVDNIEQIFQILSKFENIEQANASFEVESAKIQKFYEENNLPSKVSLLLMSKVQSAKIEDCILFRFLYCVFDRRYNEKQYQLIFGCNPLSNQPSLTQWESYRDQYIQNLVYLDVNLEIQKKFALPFGRNPIHFFMMFRCTEPLYQFFKKPFVSIKTLLFQEDYFGFTPIDYFLIYFNEDDFPFDSVKTKRNWVGEFMLELEFICDNELLLSFQDQNYQIGSFSSIRHKRLIKQFEKNDALFNRHDMNGHIVMFNLNAFDQHQPNFKLGYSKQDFLIKAQWAYSSQTQFYGLEKNLDIMKQLLHFITFGDNFQIVEKLCAYQNIMKFAKKFEILIQKTKK